MKRLQVKMDAEKEMCDLQREELELRKRIEDDKIMKMDLTGMSDRQRLYYE